MIYKSIAATSLLLGTSSASYMSVGGIGSGFAVAEDRGRIRFKGQRGPTPIATADFGAATNGHVEINYMQSVESEVAMTKLSTTLLPASGDGFGRDVEIVGDHVTGDMLFVGQTGPATAFGGSVYIYRGEHSQWSVSQVLSPPDEYKEDSYFGATLDVDPVSMRKAVVGCKNCNVTTGGGTLYVYGTSPSAESWKKEAELTTSSDMYKVGGLDVEMYEDVIVSDYKSEISDDSATTNAVIFTKKGPKWQQTQSLSVWSNATTIDLYDNTIVIGSAETSANSFENVGSVSVFYPNTQQFHLKPKGKPVPKQWSVQQVLYADRVATASGLAFGSTVTIDGDRMGIASTAAFYIYERESAYGKWSVQQTITDYADVLDADLKGASLMIGGDSSNALLSETTNWDCIIVSVEDHMGDGWDSAKLTAKTPGGDEDYFAPRCDLENPYQFRYCPRSKGDSGLYRFSIPEAVKAQFHWEIVWRVYEESTGNWYTGNWDTKMDFHWDSDSTTFSSKKMDRLLPNNITCKFCPNKPSASTGTNRKLHSKDNTLAPTISPAPTITTSETFTWQNLEMISGSDHWFDETHKGTSYYISDAKGHRLLSTGTMCNLEVSGKTCWEEFPDGEYILRVGGALDKNVADNHFRYCYAAESLDAQSQMNFRITNGDCAVVSYASKAAVCANSVKIPQLVVTDLLEIVSETITLTGISAASFGKTERVQFEDALKNTLSASQVQVVNVGKLTRGVLLDVDVFFSGRDTHIDFMDFDALDSFEAGVLSNLESVERDLSVAIHSQGEKSNLAHVTGISIGDVRLSGSKEVILNQLLVNEEVEDFASEESADLETSSHESTNVEAEVVSMMSTLGYVLTGAGVVAALAMLAVTRFSMGTPVEIEGAMDQSVPDVESPASSKKAAHASLTLADLQELVSTEEEGLKTMLGTSPSI